MNNTVNAGLPSDVQKSMDAYAANPDSYSARNAVFQNLYKDNQGIAADIAGQRTEGYNGLMGALKQAYGVSDSEAADIAALNKMGAKGQRQAEQQSDQQETQQGGGAPGSILPGNDTQSALSVLQRR